VPQPHMLLVIGVHREELAFGDLVAKGLGSCGIDLLRIPSGLSARRPRADELEQYRTNHARLYEQILSYAAPNHTLLVDLHCSLKSHTDFDLIAADTTFLDTILKAFRQTPSMAEASVRAIQMVSETDFQSATPPSDRLYIKPDLPPSVWRSPKPIYIGIEAYLEQEGKGTRQEWEMAQDLIKTISHVSESEDLNSDPSRY